MGLATLLLAACSTSKREHFSFAKHQEALRLPTSLRIDGAYVQEAISWDTMYSIYQFYQDGKCYWSNWQKGNYRFEKLDRTDFPSGQFCFFRNRGDSVIVEIKLNTDEGFTFQKGLMDEGFFCIYSMKPRGVRTAELPLPQPECFRFIPFTR